jgi:hypothetical protein
MTEMQDGDDESPEQATTHTRFINATVPLDVTDEEIESAVAAELSIGTTIAIVASVPLPPLVVRDVQDPALITVDGQVIRRREILFGPP